MPSASNETELSHRYRWNNITAGVRGRGAASRTREAGNVDDIQAAASAANTENCFIKLSVDFTTARGWLQRLVRSHLLALMSHTASSIFQADQTASLRGYHWWVRG